MTMKILVGYLPTPEGEAALHHAIDEARRRRARIVVLHSSEPFDRVDPDQSQLERDSTDMIGRILSNESLDHEVVWTHGRLNPAQEILRVATEMEVDLIVIGIRRRSSIGKLLLGSNAQEVILNADVPVLCVRPRSTDE